MEKYSKSALEDFYKKLKKDVEEAEPKDVMKMTRLVSSPERLPRALIVYNLLKTSSVEIAENINPLRLRDYLLEHYQIEWLDWLPEVTDKTLFGEERNDVLSNKIQSLRACLCTDTPWQEWHIFENVGESFNHEIPDFNYLTPLTTLECASTMYVMQNLRDEEQFSEEVLAYIGAVAATEQYVYLPEEELIGQALPALSNFVFDKELQYAVKEAWFKIKDRDLTEVDFNEESAVEIQLSKLAILKQFLKEYING